MQIYTQNLNHARKNINFFESTSQQVNESTSFCGAEGSVMGLLGSAWVCFGVCEKKLHLFHPLNPIYT